MGVTGYSDKNSYKGYFNLALNWTHGAILLPSNFKEYGGGELGIGNYHTYNGDVIKFRYPEYVIELVDTAINFIPKSAIRAICEHINDPSYGTKLKTVDKSKEDILKELKDGGVKNIYITACGYIVNSYTKSHYQNYNPLYEAGYQAFALDLHNMARTEHSQYDGLVYLLKTGIFDPVNVKIFSLKKNEPDTLNTVDKMSGCYYMYLEVDKIGQFYLVAMPDSETIIINQVIIANESIMNELVKRLKDGPTLDNSLNEIKSIVKDLNLQFQTENKSAISRLTELIQCFLNIPQK